MEAGEAEGEAEGETHMIRDVAKGKRRSVQHLSSAAAAAICAQ